MRKSKAAYLRLCSYWSISTTKYEYERILTKHMLPAIGSKSLVDLSARDILAITDKLRHTPTECRPAHAAMSSFFGYCVPRYLPLSPMTGLKNPTKPKKRERVLSYSELALIWAKTATLSDFNSVARLCILLGLRRSEAAAIQPAWIADGLLTLQVRRISPANLVEGDKNDEGYSPLGTLGISVQGVDAHDAWRIALVGARDPAPVRFFSPRFSRPHAVPVLPERIVSSHRFFKSRCQRFTDLHHSGQSFFHGEPPTIHAARFALPRRAAQCVPLWIA